jgi:phosphatidylserine decarboxylase
MMMKNYGIPVAAEGWPFILPLAVATGILFALGWRNTAVAALVLTLFVLFFFRDPERSMPEGEGLVVSPADGRVIVVKDVFEPNYLKQDVKQISIFLSVFNVHVNRVPVSGTVEAVKYNPGKFLAAWDDKASLDNEQTAMVVLVGKQKVLVKQIAGLIARRIVCYAKPGDAVTAGERYGLIRFGSRVDLFVPKTADIMVQVGDRIKGKRDVVAVLK